MNITATQLLDSLLEKRLPAGQYDWLHERLSLARDSNSLRDFHIGFGLIPRRLGKQDLAVTDEENRLANTVLEGWTLTGWSIDMCARVLLLCTMAQNSKRPFGELFKSLCQSADLGESISLYKGTALFPQSDELDWQIGEGLRTHIRTVFEAIAHNNPYPAEHFTELRWNHMVLKALFIESTLYPIQGLDSRANAELARILCDYAHERWSANRSVTPELWRCVGPFAKGNMLDDLQRALASESILEQSGAILALSACPEPGAHKLLENYPAQRQAVANGELSWDSIAEELIQHS